MDFATWLRAQNQTPTQPTVTKPGFFDMPVFSPLKKIFTDPVGTATNATNAVGNFVLNRKYTQNVLDKGAATATKDAMVGGTNAFGKWLLNTPTVQEMIDRKGAAQKTMAPGDDIDAILAPTAKAAWKYVGAPLIGGVQTIGRTIQEGIAPGSSSVPEWEKNLLGYEAKPIQETYMKWAGDYADSKGSGALEKGILTGGALIGGLAVESPIGFPGKKAVAKGLAKRFIAQGMDRATLEAELKNLGLSDDAVREIADSANMVKTEMKGGLAVKTNEIQNIIDKAIKDANAVPKGPASSVVQVVTKNGDNVFYTVTPQDLKILKEDVIDGTSRGVAGKVINGDIYHLTAKTPTQMLENSGWKNGGQKGLADIIEMIQPKGKRVPIRGEGGKFQGSFVDTPAYAKVAGDIAEERTLIEQAREYKSLDAFVKEKGRVVNLKPKYANAVRTIEDAGGIEKYSKTMFDTVERRNKFPSYSLEYRNADDEYKRISGVLRDFEDVRKGLKITQRENKVVDLVDIYKKAHTPGYKADIGQQMGKNLTFTQMRKALEDILGRNVDLQAVFEKDMVNKGAPAETMYRTIRALAESNTIEEFVGKHEGWHLFKRFLKDEKAEALDALEMKFMKENPDLEAGVRARYAKELSDKQIAEEVFADEFARWYTTGKGASFSNGAKMSVVVRNMFERFAHFVEQLFGKKKQILNEYETEFENVAKTLREDSAPRNRYTEAFEENAKKDVPATIKDENFKTPNLTTDAEKAGFKTGTLHKIYEEIADGYDMQMREGVIDDGKFIRSSKQDALENTLQVMDEMKRKYPREYELARRWDVAGVYDDLYLQNERFKTINYDDLPSEIPIYRGTPSDGALTHDPEIFTYSRDVAQKFAGKNGRVVEFVINKKDLPIANINTMLGEWEVTIEDPLKTLKKNVLKVDERGTPLTRDGKGLADPVEGGVYYHGTTPENKASLLKNGIDTKLNKSGPAEQPEAFYVGDHNEAGWYGGDRVAVRVKPGEKINTLSVTSQEWADTVGKSMGKEDTRKALIELRSRGYDAVNYGDEIEILNPGKFEVTDVPEAKKQSFDDVPAMLKDPEELPSKKEIKDTQHLKQEALVGKQLSPTPLGLKPTLSDPQASSYITDIPSITDIVNLDKLDISPAGKEFIQKTADDVRPLVEAKVGKTLTNDEVREYAKNNARIMDRTLGREQTEAWEAALYNTREKLARLAERGIVDQEYIDTLLTVKTLGTDMARKLQSLSMKAQPAEATALDAILEDIIRVTGNAEEVLKAAKGVNFKDYNEAVKFYRKFIKPTMGDWIDLLRYNSMLSSPLTHIVNTFSNLVNSLVVGTLEKAAVGGIDAIKGVFTGKRQRFAGEALAFIDGYARNTGDAVDRFVKALKGDMAISNLDTRNIPMIVKPGVAKVVEQTLSIPMRFLEASDQFFTALTEGGELASLKYREGKGIKVRAPIVKAQEAARYRLYRQELNSEGQGPVLDAVDKMTGLIYSMRSSDNPIIRNVAKWTVPFVRTPMNIFKQGLEYSPVGLTTIPGATDKELQLAKAMIGSTVFGVSALLLSSDRLTFGEPTNEKERTLWRDAGKQSYSVKMGDTWVSYQKLPPPLAFPLSLVAAIDQAQKDRKIEDSTIEMILGGVAKYGNFLADQSYAKSIGDLLGAINGGESEWARLAGNYPQQVIPFRAMGGWLSKLLDNVQRKPDPEGTFVDKQVQLMMMNIPGLSDNVPARTNQFGDEITNENNFINAFSPVRISEEKPKGVANLTKYLADKMESAKEKEARANFKTEVFLPIQEMSTEEAKAKLDAMTEEEYDMYKSVRTSWRSTNMRTVRDFLGYDPREAVQFVRELPEDEAKRVLDLLTDEEYALYQTGKDK